MQRERGIIAWMAGNPVAANLLMLVIVFAGLRALNEITKEVFPTFPSDTFTITVPYPGSAPEEVEEGILVKIEEEIQDLVGIDEIRSVAMEGGGTVTVKLVPDADLTKVLGQAKTRVDGISSFPLDAEEPIIEEVLARTAAMRLTLFGDLDEHQLKYLADSVRDDVLAIPGISHADIIGTRNYEISIELSDRALRRYGLDFNDVVNLVRDRSRDLPGGRLRTDHGSITLRSEAQAYSGEEYAALVLISRPDGTRITLGDVATIRDGFEDQPILSRMNRRQSITIQVDRVGDQSVLAITDALRTYVERKQVELPRGVEIQGWSDSSVILHGRINLLLKSALQGSILVVLTLALFLDLRLAFWVIIGVPFSFLGALAAISLFGIPVSINVLSVFAFILVLGILVDDGIVTAESAYSQLEAEGQGIDSIVRGVRRVAVPTVFGALTTMIAFGPALFMKEGFARVFTHIGPVVILSLMFSLIETKLILPAHLRHIRMPGERQRSGWLGRVEKFQGRTAGWLKHFAETRYRRTLERAVRQRYLTLALFLAVLVLTVALLPAGILRYVFFPNVPADYIVVQLEMPEGTAWQKTHEYGLHMEQAAVAVDARYQQATGSEQSVIRALMVSATTDTKVNLVIELLLSTERSITSVELADWLREEIGELSGIKSLSFDANAGPSGAPVDIELAGADLDTLRQAAYELKAQLLLLEGVNDIRDTFNAGGPEMDIRVTAEGEALGLGQVALARQVRQAFFGAEVQRVQRGRHEVRVYVRFPAERRNSLEALHSMWINLPDGRKVPFSVVAEAHEGTGVSTINRFGRARVVNVRGDVNKATTEPGAVNRIVTTELLPPLLEKYPGLTVRLAGEAEAQAETSATLAYGTVVIMLMIYAALAIPLKSYTQPLIIMSVIPFGLVGALLGHLILGKEVNALSLVGMIGLVGVVVNDSLVLVDFINHRIKLGHAWNEAVLQAGVRRFRAVILTSVTTFVGLLPIQLETSIQSNFVKPMAISVAFGVLFATTVTLLLVPALYFIGRDLRGIFSGTEKSLGAPSESA